MTDKINRKYVKCLVCLRVVEELFTGIESLSPFRKHTTGSYIVESKNALNSVEYRKTETAFHELIEPLCNKMGEYVRVFNKSSRQIEVIPLLIKGNMNADLHLYEIVKDGDIESLEFYCESVISEYEDQMLELFKEGVSINDYKKNLCRYTDLCKYSESDPKFKSEL